MQLVDWKFVADSPSAPRLKSESLACKSPSQSHFGRFHGHEHASFFWLDPRGSVRNHKYIRRQRSEETELTHTTKVRHHCIPHGILDVSPIQHVVNGADGIQFCRCYTSRVCVLADTWSGLFWSGSFENGTCGSGIQDSDLHKNLRWVTIHQKSGPVRGRNSVETELAGCCLLMENLGQ